MKQRAARRLRQPGPTRPVDRLAFPAQTLRTLERRLEARRFRLYPYQRAVVDWLAKHKGPLAFYSPRRNGLATMRSMLSSDPGSLE